MSVDSISPADIGKLDLPSYGARWKLFQLLHIISQRGFQPVLQPSIYRYQSKPQLSRNLLDMDTIYFAFVHCLCESGDLPAAQP